MHECIVSRCMRFRTACALTVYIMFSVQFRRFQYIGCISKKHHYLMKCSESVTFQQYMQMMLLQFHAVAGALPQCCSDLTVLFNVSIPPFRKFIILLRNGSRPRACTSPLGSERQTGMPSH